jgi:hypothetical protein
LDRADVEVEIFNPEIWAADYDEVLAVMKARYLTRVLTPSRGASMST